MADRELRRQAILEAMVRVAGRQGYQATAVGDVVAEANASRATFYKYFDNKEDCFLAACELVLGRIQATVLEACEGTRDWSESARRGLAAVIDLFAAEPDLARVATIEAQAAGEEARRLHWATVRRLARTLDGGRPRHPRLPPHTALMAVGGVVALIFDRLREGQAADLPQLLPQLEFALLVPFVGPQAAIADADLYAARGQR